MTGKTWGWTSYKSLHWTAADDPKLKYYEALFYRDNSPETYSRQRVCFWARHPILALRQICDSGREPFSFDRQEVN
jgi:hypothetical protein